MGTKCTPDSVWLDGSAFSHLTDIRPSVTRWSMIWNLLVIAVLLIALGMLVARRGRVVGRHNRVLPRNNALPGARRGPGLFDARAWPPGGAAPGPENYHRPAGIHLENPAILPPPREMPDE